MKKLLYTLLAVSIIFSACKKEDEEPSNTNNNSASIVGGWDFTELHHIDAEGYYLGGYPNGTKVITDSADDIALAGDTSLGIQSANWTFSSDGNLNSTVIETNGYVETDVYTYEQNGNILTIDSDDIWSIVTLSSSQLIINTSGQDTLTQNWDPNNDTVYFYEWSQTIKWARSLITVDNSASKMIHSNKDSFYKKLIERKKNRN
jgi:hypothetical protein